MKCPNCSEEIKDTAKWCGYCGHKIEQETITSEPDIPVPPPPVEPVPEEKPVEKEPKNLLHNKSICAYRVKSASFF